ncbi:MAG: hypothetical protein MZV65_12795 [Chromatiales bacterium]|nr:hypothetical protein [Chromatiales bacterium]
MYELMDALKSDKLTVALVAEFSRGKTELINAIFFADYRPAPAAVDGRAHHHVPDRAAVRRRAAARASALLPIETRAHAMTIAEYKRERSTGPRCRSISIRRRQMADVTARTDARPRTCRCAAAEGARAVPSGRPRPWRRARDGQVEISVWRHAADQLPASAARSRDWWCSTPRA